MTDIRQSPKYAQFMREIGWQVEKVGKRNAFIKKFPLFGSLIKIQRISPPVPFFEIEKLATKHRAFKTMIEFDYCLPSTVYGKYKICNSPFLPTKTIIIDLKRTEKEIFDSFTPEKRRAIRKAEKNGIITKEVDDPKDFIWLKKYSLLEKLIFPFGSKKEILALWKTFAPNQARILIACQNRYSNQCHSRESGNLYKLFYRFRVTCNCGYSVNKPGMTNYPLAGILLLFYQKTAYYWQAAATKQGKKLSAPSLLVWEALKLAKKMGCTEFDFEGINDERFPIASWKGFTKFKSGFGGGEVIYPSPIFSSTPHKVI